MNRRKFLENSAAIGAAGIIAPSVIYKPNTTIMASSPAFKDDISLAQWALVEEIRAGKWKNLDFPKIAREDFGVNGIEFVNTLSIRIVTRSFTEITQRYKDGLYGFKFGIHLGTCFLYSRYSLPNLLYRSGSSFRMK